MKVSEICKIVVDCNRLRDICYWIDRLPYSQLIIGGNTNG